MEIIFHTQEELYRRLYPALHTKKRQLQKKGIKFIEEENIWEYCKKNKWCYINGLSLSDMVDDILHIEATEILKEYEKKQPEKDGSEEYVKKE